ncbi:Histone-lysine N-methyltransferase set9 [Colletotrichum chlorophyti]|uniref:Histone-lysine N-methyltransferase SET9 n=1 Tax=Colletotrichum chlorophyti TaxID=708187 RepID=A0A1Q8RTE7_9PEZI|nr:Histone-lysine N-methyltransferase set9 [Colletotrichum chlorophyti]
MPPSAAATKKQKQKQTLTLAQLASYDDFLTDALVDHVFYWTTIPKNRNSYHPTRGVREEDITKIIQNDIVVNKDLESAERNLLATDGFRKFFTALKTDTAKDDFKRHMRRYTQIYLPDSPFEVNSTNRYTIVSHEAAITARRFIRRNETIKYLAGTQVTISPEEEREMTARKKDFSIIISARNKCASLFMGPARFANHDCAANAKLMTTGSAGIEIIATKNIEVGEEITVTYAENYFGEDNCECLCRTCEEKCVNGWASAEGQVVVKKSIEDCLVDGYSLRRRRRDDSTGPSSRTPSVTPDIRPRVSKSRARAGKSCRDSLAVDSPTLSVLSTDNKRSYDSLVTPPITPSKRRKLVATQAQATTAPAEAPTSSRDSSASQSERSMSLASGGNEDGSVTDITEPEKDTPEPSHILSKTELVKEEEYEESTEKILAKATPFPSQGLAKQDTTAASTVEAIPSSRETSVTASRSIPISSLCNTPSPPSKMTGKGVRSSRITVSSYCSGPASSTQKSMNMTAVFSGAGPMPVMLPANTGTVSNRLSKNSMRIDDMLSTTKEPFVSCHRERLMQTSSVKSVKAVTSVEKDVLCARSSETAQATLKVEAQVSTEDPAPILDNIDVCAVVDETTEGEAFADDPDQPPMKKRKYQRRTFIKETTPPAKTRTPGDYTLTPLLLSEPQTAWVRCTNCETAFVQQNAYYTKSSCPRCERHSKLYGYIWPKTEKDGPRDKEERILDHRTIHRFLGRDDEARIRGRKRLAAGASETLEEVVGMTRHKRHGAADEDFGEAEDKAGLRRSGRMRKASIKVTYQ